MRISKKFPASTLCQLVGAKRRQDSIPLSVWGLEGRHQEVLISISLKADSPSIDKPWWSCTGDQRLFKIYVFLKLNWKTHNIAVNINGSEKKESRELEAHHDSRGKHKPWPVLPDVHLFLVLRPHQRQHAPQTTNKSIMSDNFSS